MQPTPLSYVRRPWRYTITPLLDRLGYRPAQLATLAHISRSWIYRVEREPVIPEDRTVELRPLINIYRLCAHQLDLPIGERTRAVTLHDLLGTPDLDPNALASHVEPYAAPPPHIPEVLPGVWWDTVRLRELWGARLRRSVARSDMEALGRRLGYAERGESIGSVGLLVWAFDAFSADLPPTEPPLTLHHVLRVDPDLPPVPLDYPAPRRRV